MTRTVYSELTQRILDKCPNVQHVDLWNRQVENMDEQYVLPFPAVFFEFRDMVDNYHTNEYSKISGDLMVYVVVENYEDHYKSRQRTTINPNALKFFDIKDEVTLALNSFATQTILLLERKRSNLVANYNNLYILEIVFDMAFWDTVNQKTDYTEEPVIFDYSKDFI